ncbi:MAG: hypothetical protein EHM63_08180 [Actinobacteria bacterium]|nr:MAG: hypothetical protein EHM63_08180 [Actinomycetota bacterium]
MGEAIGSEPNDGVAHLQAAALEMIAAARAFLEVAERVVQNPDAVRTAVGTVGAMAKAVMQTVDPASTKANGDRDADDQADPPIEHITLS